MNEPAPASCRVQIDGKWQTLPSGSRLLDALQALADPLPALCSDERLQPVGDCGLCAVEVETAAGVWQSRTACMLPASEGLRLRTHSPALQQFRQHTLQALAAYASADDLARFPDKPLHRALQAAGIAAMAAPGSDERLDVSHPLIRVDMSRCIRCFRCVRICEDLQGQSVWHALGRGSDIRIVADTGVPLGESSCVGCGACVDSCPTAALTDATTTPAVTTAGPLRWTRTVCPYCGVGCEMDVASRGDRIVQVKPALDSPVNKGHLCVKGRYGYGHVDAPDRPTQPLLRVAGRLQPLAWEAALDHVAERLAELRSSHGADAIGVLGSARATNEDNYLAQKFARVVIGTHNVDNCARVCHTPSAAALKRMLGTGAACNSFDDIERAQLILLAGCNPTHNHPVVGARIRQQVKRGARLIVIDPRRTELCALADHHLAIHPGSNIALFLAMANTILAEDLVDHDFLAARVDGLEAFRAHVQAWTAERAAGICGVDAAAIRAAARLYANSKPALCFHGLGLTEHVQGTENVMALTNLALLCGQIGKPGAGINPLRGQNNVQGAAHMGCDPSILPGSIAIKHGRERAEAVWGVALSPVHGLNLMQMLDAAEAGTLKALLVIGFDVLTSLPNRARLQAALGKLDLLVVVDPFVNETAAQLAHVLLPAQTSFEKDGTFMNSERRVSRVRQVVSARPGARSDSDILCALASRMGHGEGFRFADAEAVWNEVRQLWPDGAGISYPRIERHGLQWPCRDASDPGSERLHADSFALGPRASLHCPAVLPSPEQTDADYPLLLNSGRTLAAFNAGTMTGRGALLALRPSDTLDLSPYDAQQFGLRDGQRIRVGSRHGEAELPLRVTDEVQPGECFVTFHDPQPQVNRLTGDGRDGITLAPEYKRTAVKLTAL